MKINNKIIVVLIVFVIVLSACSPAITKETAKEEIVSFMLDYIAAKGPADSITWFPPVKDNLNWFSIMFLDEWVNRDKPIKVWSQNNPHPNSLVWSRYEFAILYISSNNQTASIYLDDSCGYLCGGGDIYTMKRNNSGKWEIKDSTRVLWH